MLEAPSKNPKIPMLESGDRLSRHEFERRYEAMPQLKKAELIEGVVFSYLLSPTSRTPPRSNPLPNLLF